VALDEQHVQIPHPQRIGRLVAPRLATAPGDAAEGGGVREAHAHGDDLRGDAAAGRGQREGAVDPDLFDQGELDVLLGHGVGDPGDVDLAQGIGEGGHRDLLRRDVVLVLEVAGQRHVRWAIDREGPQLGELHRRMPRLILPQERRGELDFFGVDTSVEARRGHDLAGLACGYRRVQHAHPVAFGGRPFEGVRLRQEIEDPGRRVLILEHARRQARDRFALDGDVRAQALEQVEGDGPGPLAGLVGHRGRYAEGEPVEVEQARVGGECLDGDGRLREDELPRRERRRPARPRGQCGAWTGARDRSGARPRGLNRRQRHLFDALAQEPRRPLRLRDHVHDDVVRVDGRGVRPQCAGAHREREHPEERPASSDRITHIEYEAGEAAFAHGVSRTRAGLL
jgi:hypothetical protein